MRLLPLLPLFSGQSLAHGAGQGGAMAAQALVFSQPERAALPCGRGQDFARVTGVSNDHPWAMSRDRQSVADGYRFANVERILHFRCRAVQVESVSTITPKRGSFSCVNLLCFSRSSLLSWLAASKTAAATATPRRQIALQSAPSVVQQQARLLQMQPAARKPKAHSSVLSLAAARAWFRAPTTATNLTARAAARQDQNFDHLKRGLPVSATGRPLLHFRPLAGAGLRERYVQKDLDRQPG